MRSLCKLVANIFTENCHREEKTPVFFLSNGCFHGKRFFERLIFNVERGVNLDLGRKSRVEFKLQTWLFAVCKVKETGKKENRYCCRSWRSICLRVLQSTM